MVRPHTRAAALGWLLRHTGIARDRRRAYLGARQAAARGDVVLSDRYPLPGILATDGPRTAGEAARAGGLGRSLIRRQRRYYGDISRPDILGVLRVDPEVAVQRRSGADDDLVRARSEEIARADWSGTGALVIDAGRTLDDLVPEVLSFVWANL